METNIHTRLAEFLTSAVNNLTQHLTERSPFLAEKLHDWTGVLSGKMPREYYFMHPEAFPMMLFPLWLDASLDQDIDWEFHQDVVYSSVNAYYFFRMIDNVMDLKNPREIKLLPLLSFLHTECLQAYFRYFDYQHPFWLMFNKIWTECAESTVADAESPEFDLGLFQETAAKKVHASKIPMAAVCLRRGLRDIPGEWKRLHDLMSRWHQMFNDTFDWQRDLESHARTFFLSEAHRRVGNGEPVFRWVAREGLAWAMDLESQWMQEMNEIARRIESSELLTYLNKRDRDLTQKARSAHEGFQALEKLFALGG